jgi:hypothetical protein
MTGLLFLARPCLNSFRATAGNIGLLARILSWGLQ